MATEFKLSYTASEIDKKLGKVDDTVTYTPQTLTEEQKAQARENIGAVGINEVIADATNGDNITLCRRENENLMPRFYPFTTEVSGITVTVAENGLITVNGSSTDALCDERIYINLVCPFTFTDDMFVHLNNSQAHSGIKLGTKNSALVGDFLAMSLENRVVSGTNSSVRGQTCVQLVLLIDNSNQAPEPITFDNFTLHPNVFKHDTPTNPQENTAEYYTIDTTDTIPTYWKSHLDEKIARVKSLQAAGGKDCFSFVVMSDMHYAQNLGKKSPILAKYVMDACDIKHLLCLGDMQNQGAAASEDDIHAEWDAINSLFAPIRDKTLMVLGNHDGAWGTLDKDGNGAIGGEEYYCYNLAPEQLYEHVYRKVGMVSGVCFDDSGNGYYVDDTVNKVRYLILNTHCNEHALNDDGTAVNNVMHKQRLTQTQHDFTIEALQSVPSDKWLVVVGTHAPLYSGFCEGTPADLSLMAELLRAYQKKGTYSGTYGTEGEYDYVSVNVDFTNSHGTIAAAFAGHDHRDLYARDGFNCILVAADCCHHNGVAFGEVGTYTEQSFDVVTINRKTGTMYTTKIGAGENRLFYYDFSYTNALESALAFTTDDIYNGTGYKENTRFDNEPPYEASANGYILTGLLPFYLDTPIYIKGFEVDTADSQCRIGIFHEDKSFYTEARPGRTGFDQLVTLTKLNDGYYEIMHNDSSVWNNTGYVCFSLLMTGETPIVSIGKPIE